MPQGLPPQACSLLSELQAVGCTGMPHPQVTLLSPQAGCSSQMEACRPLLMHNIHFICWGSAILCPADNHVGIQSVERKEQCAQTVPNLFSSQR